MMKVLIAGGGTGGHLYPGLAVAEAFRERDAQTLVTFVGTNHGIEARVVPREGYAFEALGAEGFVGKGFTRQAKALGVFVKSLFQARKIIRRTRPAVVVGVGGYASVATVLMAHAAGIPTLIMEQNSVAGVANRFLGRFADAIAVTYQESLADFPRSKTFLTGNPVRKNLVAREVRGGHALFGLEPERCTVFVFGGSLGARTINRAMTEALPYLLDLRPALQFLHQTGEQDHATVREAYRKLGFLATAEPFIYQMAEAYQAADFVICRAGATTLAEITAIGKAALLVPFPFAAANHQEHNARKLEDLGAARMLPDRECTGEALAGAIRELYTDKESRLRMQRASKSCGKVDAADRIVDLALRLIRKR